MTRVLIIPFLALSLALAACNPFSLLDPSGISVLKGGSSITAQTNNPVTPSMLLDVEESLIVVTAGLQTYKNLCTRKTIDRSCRDVIARIQSYTRPARKLLPQLRAAVRKNNQVNAISLFREIRSLVASAQQIAAENNVGAK